MKVRVIGVSSVAPTIRVFMPVRNVSRLLLRVVAGLRTAKRFGAELRLLNASERVHSTLYIARLLPIFEIHKNEGEALQRFAENAGTPGGS